MARVVFKAAGSLAETASSATLGIVAPVTAPDDVMIALYHANDNLVVTLPSGWGLLGTQTNNTTAQTVLVAWKRAGTADSGATFNFVKSSNNSLLSCGAIITYTFARPGNPFDGFSINANTPAADNTVFAALTTTAFSRLNFVQFYGLGATTPAAPSGTNCDGGSFSSRLDAEATLGATATISVQQGSLTIPGAVGVGTAASNSTVDAISVGFLFSIVSDDQSGTGYSATSYGTAGGPGGRFRPNPRGKTEEV